MRKHVAALVGCLMLLPGLAACSSGEDGGDDGEAKTLKVVTNATLPPQQYVDTAGEIAGYNIDLVNALADELGYDLEWINAPFDSQIPGLQQDRYDVSATGAFYTPERAQQVSMVPYLIQGVSVSVENGNPNGVSVPTDLSGMTVGAEAPGFEFDVLNQLNEDFAAKGLDPIVVRSFTTTADSVQALRAGQIDGIATLDPVAANYEIEGEFTVAVKNLSPSPVTLAFGDADLATEFAEALTSMRESGDLDALMVDKWGLRMWPLDFAVTTGEVTVTLDPATGEIAVDAP